MSPKKINVYRNEIFSHVNATKTWLKTWFETTLTQSKNMQPGNRPRESGSSVTMIRLAVTILFACDRAFCLESVSKYLCNIVEVHFRVYVIIIIMIIIATIIISTRMHWHIFNNFLRGGGRLKLLNIIRQSLFACLLRKSSDTPHENNAISLNYQITRIKILI